MAWINNTTPLEQKRLDEALDRAERDYWDKVREDYVKREQKGELMESLGDTE